MPATINTYGQMPNGEEIHQFVFKNTNGIEVRCINYGCRITHFFVPGANTQLADIVLGFDSLQEYVEDDTFQGAIVGRFANRIEDAKFSLENNDYSLTKNDGENYLHGSFCDTVFNAQVMGENSVLFTCLSPAGEDGFPGNMNVRILYTLTKNNEFIMDYYAISDEATVVNITNHAYFNLAGHQSGTLTGQNLRIAAKSYLEVKSGMCPTGRLLPTFATPFDFNSTTPILQNIDSPCTQLALGGGYDHCFVLDKPANSKWALAVSAAHPASGRCMHVYTTQPAVQLYTGNFLDGSIKGKGRHPLNRRGAFCLETQRFPSAPTQSGFPSATLQPGQMYHKRTSFAPAW